MLGVESVVVEAVIGIVVGVVAVEWIGIGEQYTCTDIKASRSTI